MTHTYLPQPILDVARELCLPDEHVIVYGRGKAKIDARRGASRHGRAPAARAG